MGLSLRSESDSVNYGYHTSDYFWSTALCISIDQATAPGLNLVVPQAQAELRCGACVCACEEYLVILYALHASCGTAYAGSDELPFRFEARILSWPNSCSSNLFNLDECLITVPRWGRIFFPFPLKGCNLIILIPFPLKGWGEYDFDQLKIRREA